jgi:hypothetical protein
VASTNSKSSSSINSFYLPTNGDEADDNVKSSLSINTSSLSSSSSSSASSASSAVAAATTATEASLLSNNLNLLSKMHNNNKSSLKRPIRRCHHCQEEFRNRALLRVHINTYHANEHHKKLSTNKIHSILPVSPSTSLGFLQPYVDTASSLAHKLVAGQATQASYGILNDSYFCAKMADRVVCEICNKQVCNKYFLKTHKGKITLNNNDQSCSTNVFNDF